MTPEEIAAMKAENEAFKAEKAAAAKAKEDEDKKKKEEEGKKGEDLDDKVKREARAKEEGQAQSKRLENALRFNIDVAALVKENGEVLPTEISDIVLAAEKETYDTAPEKAAAIRTAIIKSFFSVQANVDLLTKTQKSSLEDYLKLTHSGKAEKSEFVFENIFEPALEMTKKLKKAEELGKARLGLGSGTKVEDDYKNRLIQISRKAYLGEKGDK